MCTPLTNPTEGDVEEARVAVEVIKVNTEADLSPEDQVALKEIGLNLETDLTRSRAIFAQGLTGLADRIVLH